MKLKPYSLNISEKLSEFDLWITPSLGDMTDEPGFQDCLAGIKHGFNHLAGITHDFESAEKCSAAVLASALLSSLQASSLNEPFTSLQDIISVLFLVTGKTDNNMKCQYPVYLRNEMGINSFINNKGRKKNLPRTLAMDQVINLIIKLANQRDEQELLVKSYLQLILPDKTSAMQLWTWGNFYLEAKAHNDEDKLLCPISLFQSRGSLVASQGHKPEEILRDRLQEWGLKPDYDYNLADVTISDFLNIPITDKDLKKRKYDFILPYRSRTDCKKIFVQCQFYAGDSGSVSHKVVDQTDSTRTFTLQQYPKAIFMEYLDGAGYFSSLAGDLRKMLSKRTTSDYFQIRTAPIKLRRALQGIQFLTALEIEHTILKVGHDEASILTALQKDGYSSDEVNKALQDACNNNILNRNQDNTYTFINERLPIIRRYCLLDTLANYGCPIPNDKVSGGNLVIPGYPVFWGLPQAKLIELTLSYVPGMNDLWKNTNEPFQDIQWLLDRKFIMMK